MNRQEGCLIKLQRDACRSGKRGGVRRMSLNPASSHWSSRRRFVLSAIALVAALVLPGSLAAQLPAGFTQTQIASGIERPTSMAFAPDGRLFICEQGGRVLVLKNGALLQTPFHTFQVDDSGERGLIGIAFDPDFSTNHFVYFYYTVSTAPTFNQIVRLTAAGDVAQLGSETQIFRLPDLTAVAHNGGALNFGPDGKLYVAVGDNVQSVVAQSLDSPFGKMLRINRDGTIPTDNPFFDQTTGNNRAIWARGLRNPFSFAIHSGNGRMYINDVGEESWEEVNEGLAGGNYGWPNCEGACGNPAFRDPVYTYPHGASGCDSVAGGAFYTPTENQFPQQYVGKYFFSDWCRSWIKVLDPATNQVTDFGAGAAWGLVDLDVAADGSLYYVLWSFGVVFKIQYTASQAPNISIHPASKTVSEGQAADFSVSATGTAPLSYQWQRNGVDIPGATANQYSLSSTVASDNGAMFRVVVTNQFGSATSNAATLTVTANQAPSGSIVSPLTGTTYAAGNTINYSGQATDPEDGPLPASAFTWRVDFHHEDHLHPFIPSTPGSASGSFVIPTTGETSSDVWYRIHLTVTDSRGLTHSVFRDVLPRLSTITLRTNPDGLRITLDGQPKTAPFTFVGVVGVERLIGIESPQVISGVTWDFTSWSDGGAVNHPISTPAASTNYIATLRARPALQFEGPSFTAAENAGVIQARVLRTINNAGAVSIAYATSPGTATPNVDYVPKAGVLDFADGEFSKTISIQLLDDAIFEDSETINLTLSNPAGAVLATPTTASLTIIENDPLPLVSVGSLSITEGNSGPVEALFIATLSNASTKEVRVNFTTVDGTALSGSDYLSRSGTLVFMPGETAKSIAVTVIGDIVAEADETFSLNLSNVSNAALGQSQSTATIKDNRNPLFVMSELTGRAAILDSVNFTTEPFSISSLFNFSADRRTRLILFLANVRLQAGDDASVVTASLEDSQQTSYPATVEHIGPVPGFSWMTQIVVRLPNQIGSAGEYRLKVTVRGAESNVVPVNLNP